MRSAYVAFEGAATGKATEVTEFGWVADPSSATFSSAAANQAQNVKTAYATFQSTTYVSRADYFAAAERAADHVIERLLRRIDHDLHFGILRDLRALLRERHGAIEAAQLVDQTDLLRLSARPYPSLADRVDPLGRGVAPLRRLLDERVVGGLHVLRHARALLRRERPHG